MSDIDVIVDVWTQQLHDNAFSITPQRTECDYCHALFYSEQIWVSDFNGDKIFCSGECAKKWDKENKEDYRGQLK